MAVARTTILLAAAVALLAACGPARRGEPLTQLSLTQNERVGQEHFIHHCHPCHPGGGSGLGPALNNKPLPRWMIRLQVRQGLGAMPDFSEEQLPPEELNAIIDYLKALRANG